jgi:hypothetical protein
MEVLCRELFGILVRNSYISRGCATGHEAASVAVPLPGIALMRISVSKVLEGAQYNAGARSFQRCDHGLKIGWQILIVIVKETYIFAELEVIQRPAIDRPCGPIGSVEGRLLGADRPSESDGSSLRVNIVCDQ